MSRFPKHLKMSRFKQILIFVGNFDMFLFNRADEKQIGGRDRMKAAEGFNTARILQVI